MINIKKVFLCFPFINIYFQSNCCDTISCLKLFLNYSYSRFISVLSVMAELFLWLLVHQVIIHCYNVNITTNITNHSAYYMSYNVLRLSSSPCQVDELNLSLIKLLRYMSASDILFWFSLLHHMVWLYICCSFNSSRIHSGSQTFYYPQEISLPTLLPHWRKNKTQKKRIEPKISYYSWKGQRKAYLMRLIIWRLQEMLWKHYTEHEHILVCFEVHSIVSKYSYYMYY